MVWPNTWPTPRYGPRIFLIALDSIMKEYYGFGSEVVQYGKPELTTFQFAHDIMDKRAKEQGIEISNYYMIGDTPESDI